MLLQLAFVWGLTLHADAATYYVDFASGSDANNGTSTNTPWKLAPGMNGFSGAYTHQAGDRFIFRGGVVWSNSMAPWNISNSGQPGTHDYYGVDKTWFSGSFWSRPVFDGGSQYPIPASQKWGYWFVSGSYITLDNLTLQNIGVAGQDQDNYAIKLTGHDLLVENMYLPVQSRICLLLSVSTGLTNGNYEFASNDISSCAWGIGGGPSAGTALTNILIHDNSFHDFHTQIVQGEHGDGIYLYTSTTNVNTYTDNVRIYRNRFWGDFSKGDTNPLGGMTAFIWTSSQIQGTAYIYNNVMTYTFTNGAAISSAICGNNSSVGGGYSSGSIYVLNNTFAADANSYYFFHGGDVSNVVILNNISSGANSGYAISYPVMNFVSDYNVFSPESPSGTFAFLMSYPTFKTACGPISTISVNTPGSGYLVGDVVMVTYGMGAFATVTGTNASGGVTGLKLNTGGIGYIGWPGKTTYGHGSGLTVNATSVPSLYESHGITNNPSFMSAGDLHLQASSSAIGAGTNLSSFFTTDYAGNTRPATGAWDIGAYQYATNTQNSASSPPSPPSGLSVVGQ